MTASTAPVPIFFLSYMFLGTVTPGRNEARFADDSGDLDITNAGVPIGYLFFLGGERPRDPFPARGETRTKGQRKNNLNTFSFHRDKRR